MSTAYAAAGVNLSAADRFEEMLKDRVARAWPDAGEEIGGFAGGGPIPEWAKRVEACTDGPGTKIIVAALMGMFQGIGSDVVAMSAFDGYASTGQAPKYMLDSLKAAKLDPDLHIQIIESIIEACKIAGCTLVGGETAEMPDLYKYPWMVDVDTFAVGFSDSGHRYAPVSAGQKIYGWPSYGIGANGYSLLRKVFKLKEGGPKKIRRRLERHWPDFGMTLAEEVLRPTPIWIQHMEKAKGNGVVFAGHAHITGGGMVANIPRVLPTGTKAIIDRTLWDRPIIFSVMQDRGNISQDEMDNVFNQGIMVASVVEGNTSWLEQHSDAFYIGEVQDRIGEEPQVEFVGSFIE